MAGRVTSTPPSPIYKYFQRIAKKIPLEWGNYPYVTARVRAKKTFLLSADVYEKML